MITKKINLYVVLSIIVLVASGCTLKAEEKVLEDVEIAAEKIFKQEKSISPNKELKSISVYLPVDFTVTEESTSNVILEKGDQTFILFYNPLEDSKSELNYEAASAADNIVLLESLEDDDRFGYISVLELKDDRYELQLGIGGVKITTRTSMGNLENDAENMMEIVSSIDDN
ncbi:hypothetical protein [Aquibacillus albus]|uniref:DUF4367 domain-containing protein n=1 Tax=Aquibacillus albus TaxID=1168171 RepID=A0ABS2N3V8_9BACI|nr:hypothetical protein [Aquibacillus albus]MBM7572830.1 hypothetical protein [Aquibacillus albus]